MENELKVGKKSYSFLGVNIVYLLCAILFLTVGALFQEMHIESGLIITEYVIILLPVFLFGLATKVDLKKSLRLKKLPLKHILLIMLMALVLIPVIFIANMFVVIILNHFDKFTLQSIPVASNGSQLLLYLFIISISAGLCEEFFFRGMVLNAYESHFSKRNAIILSAILFGLFHYNLQNLAGPIVLGLVFGYLVIVTDSIWAGVIAHATNNGIAVLNGYFMSGVSAGTGLEDVDQTQAALETLKFPQVIPSLILFILVAGVCLYLATRVIRMIERDYVVLEEGKEIYISKKKYKILSMGDDVVEILSVKHYDLENFRDKIKRIHKGKIRKYPLKAVEVEEARDKDMVTTLAKMLPILISIIIYAFLWTRYLL